MAKTKQLTREEVAKHASEDSCWIIVENKVYDVTNWLDTHPGGREVLLENAGRDATSAFANVGHTQSAKDMMSNYLIGELAGPAACCCNRKWLVVGGLAVVLVGVAVLWSRYRK